MIDFKEEISKILNGDGDKVKLLNDLFISNTEDMLPIEDI